MSIPVGDEVISDPYRAEVQADSANHGYIDLRADIGLIALAPEAQGWPELQLRLTALNQPHSPFRSLGCEKSISPFDSDAHPYLKLKLTSYVDIAFADCALNRMQQPFEEMMSADADFAISQRCQFAEFGAFAPEFTKATYRLEQIEGWCLSVWIHGLGDAEAAARTAWATVMAAFTAFVGSGWKPSAAAMPAGGL